MNYIVTWADQMTKCCPKAWLEKSSWNSYSSMVVMIHPLRKRQCKKWHRKPTHHPTWFQNSSQLVLCNHMTLMKLEELILYHQLLALLRWFWNLGDVIHSRLIGIFFSWTCFIVEKGVFVCVRETETETEKRSSKKLKRLSWADLFWGDAALGTKLYPALHSTSDWMEMSWSWANPFWCANKDLQNLFF